MTDRKPLYYNAEYLDETLKSLKMLPYHFAKYCGNVSKSVISKILRNEYQTKKSTQVLTRIVRNLKKLGVDNADRFITPPEETKETEEKEENPVITQDMLNFFNFDSEPFLAGITSNVWFNKENQTIVDIVIDNIKKSEMLSIIGSVGTGKSTLFKYIKAKLSEEKNIRFATVPKRIIRRADSALLVNIILKQICEITKVPFKCEDREETLIKLLDEIGQENIKPVIFLDETHLLNEESWKNLKMLWEDYFESDTPISIVAFAQPLLRSTFAKSSMIEVSQRTKTYTITSFSNKAKAETEADVKEYIRFKLDLAGAKREIFENEAIKVISKKCNTPLDVNLICRRSMVRAYDITSNTVTDQIVQSVLPRR